MTEILQNDLPYDMLHHRALPGVSPLAPEAWLIVDEAYSAHHSMGLQVFIQEILPQLKIINLVY